MMTVMKWIGFGMGVCILAAVASLLAADRYLNTEVGQRWLKAEINGAIPGTVDWVDLKLDMMQGQIDLTGVRLTTAAPKHVATIDRAVLALDVLPLAKGELYVPLFRVISPVFSLESDPSGRLNLMSVFADPKPPSDDGLSGSLLPWPLRLRIGRARVESGRFDYRGSSGSWRIDVDETELTGKIRFHDTAGNAHLRIGGARMDASNMSVRLISGEVGFFFSEDRLEAIDSKLAFPGSHMELKGVIGSLFSDPTGDLTLTAGIDLNDLRDMFRMDLAMTGQVMGAIHLKDSLQRPRLSARIRYDGGQLGPYRLDSGTLLATVDHQRVALQEVVLAAGEGRARVSGEIDLNGVFPEGLLRSPVTPQALTYSLSLEQRGMALASLLPGSTRTSGTMTATAELAGSGVASDHLNATLGLWAELNAFTIDGRPIADTIEVKTTASVSPDRFQVEGLKASAGSLTLEGGGHLDRRGQTVSAVLDIASPDLSRLPEVLGRTRIQGDAGAQARLTGSVSAPKIALNLQGNDIAYGPYRLGSLAAGATIDSDGRIRLDGLTIENHDSHITGSGILGSLSREAGFDPSAPVAATLTFDPVDIGHFVTDGSIRGRGRGSLMVNGLFSRPEAAADLTASGLETEGVAIGDIEGEVAFSAGTLSTEGLKLTNGRSALTLAGWASLIEAGAFEMAADPAIDLHIERGRLYLEDFSDTASGAVNIWADIGGTLSGPSGTAGLKGTNLSVWGQTVDIATLEARLKDDRILIDSLEADIEQEKTIRARGWVDRRGGYDITADIRNLSLQRIEGIDDLKSLRGILSADIHGSGSFEQPHFTGDASITDLHFDGQPLDSVRLSFRMDPSRIAIDSTLGFDLEGELAWREGVFSVSARFDETALGPYFSLAGRPELSGQMTGSLTADGHLKDLPQVRADVALASTRVYMDDRLLVSSEEVRARMRDGVLDIPPATLIVAEDGRMAVEGHGGVDGEIRFLANGDIPMGVISRLTDTLPDSSGRLKASVEVTGSMTRPSITAIFQLDQVAFTVPTLGQKFHGVRGTIRATPTQATVDRIDGFLDDGTFALKGSVDLKNFRPMDVNLSLQTTGLPVAVPDTLSLEVDSALTLTGKRETMRLSGWIAIAEGVYYKDFKLKLTEAIGQIRRPKTGSTPIHLPPDIASTGLNVSLRSRKPLSVDNNLALLAIEPDLKVTGSVRNPVLSGRTDIRSGSIRYGNREFIVTRGIVDFINPYRIEPRIDLAAETDIRRWTISLLISGTPDDLDIELVSNPPEPNEEILSLLAFGKTTDERLSAGATASEFIANTLTPGIKDATGIDRLEINYETNTENGKEEEEIKVTVGKELSRRLSIEYGTEARSGERIQRVTSDYKLLERLIVSAFQDTAGDYGGELKFRLEFR